LYTDVHGTYLEALDKFLKFGDVELFLRTLLERDGRWYDLKSSKRLYAPGISIWQ